MNMSAIRYDFVDILKGIAILLIVYGHIMPGSIPFLTKWVSTFHIPLFFFISGLLYNDIKYYADFKGFIKSRAKGLVLPFLIFSTIVAIGYLFVSNDYSEFITTLFTNGWGGYALLFVPVLFLVELLYYPISKIESKYRIFVLILCAVLSYFSSVNIGLLSNNVLLTFCGIWFYGIGNLCRPLLRFSLQPCNKCLMSMTVFGILLSFIYKPFCDILPEWFINKIPSPIYFCSLLFAIVGMIGISILVKQFLGKIIVGFFSTCGKQSLIILAFHQIICMIAQQYLPSKIAILIMILFLTFLVWFIPKYLPWMLGKTKI